MKTFAQNDPVQVRDPANRLSWRRASVIRPASHPKDSAVCVTFRGSTVQHQVPWTDVKPLTNLVLQTPVIAPVSSEQVVDLVDDDSPDDHHILLDDTDRQHFPSPSHPHPPFTDPHISLSRFHPGHPSSVGDRDSTSSLQNYHHQNHPHHHPCARSEWKQEDRYAKTEYRHATTEQAVFSDFEESTVDNRSSHHRSRSQNLSRYFHHPPHRQQHPQQTNLPPRPTSRQGSSATCPHHDRAYNPLSSDGSPIPPTPNCPSPRSPPLNRQDHRHHTDSIRPVAAPPERPTISQSHPPPGGPSAGPSNIRASPDTQYTEISPPTNHNNTQVPYSTARTTTHKITPQNRHPNVWHRPDHAPRVPRKQNSSHPRSRGSPPRRTSGSRGRARSLDSAELGENISAFMRLQSEEQFARRKPKKRRVSIWGLVSDSSLDYGHFERTAHSGETSGESRTAIDDVPNHTDTAYTPVVTQAPDIVPMFEANNPLLVEQCADEKTESVLSDADAKDLLDLDELSSRLHNFRFVPFPVRQGGRRSLAVCKHHFEKKSRTDHRLQSTRDVSRPGVATSSGSSNRQLTSPSRPFTKSGGSSNVKPTYITDIECVAFKQGGNPATTGLLVHECLCGQIEEPDEWVRSGLRGSIQCGQCALWSHLRCLQVTAEEVEEFCSQKRRFVCWNCVSAYPTCHDVADNPANDNSNTEQFKGAIQLKPALPFRRSSHAEEFNFGTAVRPKKCNKIRKPLGEEECRERAKNVEALREGLSPPLVDKKEQALIDALLARKLLNDKK